MRTGALSSTMLAASTALVAALAAPVSAEPDCGVHGACCFVRTSPPMRVSRPPPAFTVAVNVDPGGLPEDVVRRYVRRAGSELERCAVRDLHVTLVIDANGAVVASTAEATPVGDCVSRVMRGLRFPYFRSATRAIVELHRKR